MQYDEEREECGFLWKNIGEDVFINVLREHLQDCQDCQKCLEDYYLDYTGEGDIISDSTSLIFDFADLPPGLSKDGFLMCWHMSVSWKGHDYLQAINAIRRKIISDEGFDLLQRVLKSLFRALRLQDLNAPDSILKSQANVAIHLVKALVKLLGSRELAMITNVEEVDLDKMMNVLKNILAGK